MLNWLVSEISPRPLGLARIIVGAAALIRSVVAWPVLTGLTDPDVLRTPFAGWLPDPTMPLVVGIVVVWFLSAVAFTVGWRVAITGPTLLASIVVAVSLDQQAYSNHLYLMAWLVLLMTLADAGAGLSISKRDRPVVRWPVLLIMLQASLVYGFSALTKLNDSFLSGEGLAGVLVGGVVPFPESLRNPSFLSALAAVVVVVELFIAIMIWHHRFRPAGFILGLGLHISITVLMASTAELAVFSLEMLALYPLFLGGDGLRVAVEEGHSVVWCRRIRRFDHLKVVECSAADRIRDIALTHRGQTTHGAAAHTRVLEHLVPWLWLAPLLRLPIVRRLHERRHPVAAEQRLGAASG